MTLAIVAALTALGALVRFVSLGTQSYWYDEAVTVTLVRDSFGGMLGGVRAHESTPPLYYALAWVWTRALGDGEVALRSLSALAGTATIPVAYLAAKLLVGRRAAVVVAALTALSPALVWYSQEARAYALMVFLCAVSMLMFLRARDRPTRGNLAGWVIACALAIGTHYFAALLVGAEALWLLARAPNRRAVATATAAVATVGIALLPLALHQRGAGGADWIGEQSLGQRATSSAYFFAVGPGLGRLDRHYELVAAVAALAFAFALGLLLRGGDLRVRKGAVVALSFAAAIVGLPVLASFVGSDYFLDRNVLAAWLPLAMAAAAGLASRGSRRLGLALAVAVCASFALIDARVPRSPSVQRDDWRGVANLLHTGRSDRVVEVAPGWQGLALSQYVPHLSRMISSRRVTVVYTVAALNGPVGGNPPGRATTPGAAFRPVSSTVVQRFRVTRYEAIRPQPVEPPALTGAGVDGSAPYFQDAP